MAHRPPIADGVAGSLARVLTDPTFELVPLRGAIDRASSLPQGATVSVTASPAKGLEATVDLAGQLRHAGFRAVPHLAARMVRDDAHLRDLLDRLDAAGVDRAFVVGGDVTDPGAFPDGLSLLRAMAEANHRIGDIGIPGYPEGHPFIPPDRLRAALADKLPFASYMTTQLCFDPRAIAAWMMGCRAEGIRLPVQIGVPGVAEVRRLVEISARIGIGDSRRFLSKNLGLVGRLARPGGYRPDGLLRGLGPLVADPAADVRGIHLYTFNQVETTEAWRRAFLAAIGEKAGRAPEAWPA